jgi:hypothetical protein
MQTMHLYKHGSAPVPARGRVPSRVPLGLAIQRTRVGVMDYRRIVGAHRSIWHRCYRTPLALYYGNTVLCRDESTGAVCHFWLNPEWRNTTQRQSGVGAAGCRGPAVATVAPYELQHVLVEQFRAFPIGAVAALRQDM